MIRMNIEITNVIMKGPRKDFRLNKYRRFNKNFSYKSRITKLKIRNQLTFEAG